MALSVRGLFFLYVPGLFLMLFFYVVIYKKKKKYLMYLLVGFMGMLFIIHAPSILHKGTLSIQNKETGPGGATWTERRYLQIWNHFNNGDNRLREWEDVAVYKKEHGENSLPKTQFQAMIKDPGLTVKNFFYIQYISHLAFIRKLGLLYLLLISIVVYELFRQRSIHSHFLMGILFFLSFSLVFAAMMMNHVEFRWYFIFPYMLTVTGIAILEKYFRSNLYMNAVRNFNYLCLGFFNILLIGVW
jgi:hypothetical protein